LTLRLAESGAFDGTIAVNDPDVDVGVGPGDVRSIGWPADMANPETTNRRARAITAARFQVQPFIEPPEIRSETEVPSETLLQHGGFNMSVEVS